MKYAGAVRAEEQRCRCLMVALYMDVHVKEAITRGLRRRGVDVLTAQEDGAARLDELRFWTVRQR